MTVYSCVRAEAFCDVTRVMGSISAVSPNFCCAKSTKMVSLSYKVCNAIMISLKGMYISVKGNLKAWQQLTIGLKNKDSTP